jgi:DNA-binding NtrC family response regulator
MCRDVAENIVRMLLENPMSCAIVDQEEGYRECVAQVVDDLGFETSLFYGREDFEESHGRRKFDLVIVSWDAESNLGEDVVEAIGKCGEPHPSLIVGCDGSLSFHLALSPVGFLFKPFDVKHFMEVIERATENRI